jgi:hypothetical protein
VGYVNYVSLDSHSFRVKEGPVRVDIAIYLRIEITSLELTLARICLVALQQAYCLSMWLEGPLLLLYKQKLLDIVRNSELQREQGNPR